MNAPKRPGRPRVDMPMQTFSIRMPEDMRKTLEQRAKANGRSVAGEIVYRLGLSLKALP